MKDGSAFLSFIDSYHYPFVIKMKEEDFQGKTRNEVSSIRKWAAPINSQNEKKG